MAQDICPHPRCLRSCDLGQVAKIYSICFPPESSIFSALDPEIQMLYFQMIIDEPESYAAVLEDTVSNRIMGLTFGTRKVGIQSRFIRKYRYKVIISLAKGLLARSAVWRAVFSRLTRKNTLSIPFGQFGPELEKHGFPAPTGPEDINIGIAMDPSFRGGGNAARLLDFYQKEVFKLGAVRIRGGILTSNLASMTFFERQGWQFQAISEEEVVVWIDRPS